MKNGGKVLLLTVFLIIGSLGYAQTAKPTTPQKTGTDSTKRIAEPTVFIGKDMLGGKTSIEKLLSHPYLTATAKDGVEWNVVSYRVTFVRNGEEDPPITVNGAEFTEQIKHSIQAVSPGTMMEFTNVRIQSSAGTKTLTAPLIVRIR